MGGARGSCAQPFLAAGDPVSFLLRWGARREIVALARPRCGRAPPAAGLACSMPTCQAPAARPCMERVCFPPSLLLGAGSCSLQTAARPASPPAAGSAERLQGRARLLPAKMGWGRWKVPCARCILPASSSSPESCFVAQPGKVLGPEKPGGEGHLRCGGRCCFPPLLSPSPLCLHPAARAGSI